MSTSYPNLLAQKFDGVILATGVAAGWRIANLLPIPLPPATAPAK